MLSWRRRQRPRLRRLPKDHHEYGWPGHDKNELFLTDWLAGVAGITVGGTLGGLVFGAALPDTLVAIGAGVALWLLIGWVLGISKDPWHRPRGNRHGLLLDSDTREAARRILDKTRADWIAYYALEQHPLSKRDCAALVETARMVLADLDRDDLRAAAERLGLSGAADLDSAEGIRTREAAEQLIARLAGWADR